MLDLQARVHLEEVGPTFLIHQKLQGAGVHVARLGNETQGEPPHLLAQLRRDERGGTLFDHLLVTPLNRAFAFEQVHGVAVGIGEHLYLDVARALEGLLQVEPVVTKRAARFSGSAPGRGSELRGLTHEAKPLAATSRGGFEHHREADTRRLGCQCRVVGHGLEGARDDRHAGGDGDAARRGLLAHLLDHVGGRANEANLGRFAGTSEVSVFGKEAVAGVDRLRTRAPRRVQDALDAQVGLRGGRGADVNGLVGGQHVQRVAVGIGVHRHH